MNFSNVAQLRNQVKKLIKMEREVGSLPEHGSGIELDKLVAWYESLAELTRKQKRSEELAMNHAGTGTYWTKAAQKRDEQLKLVQEMAKKVLSL